MKECPFLTSLSIKQKAVESGLLKNWSSSRDQAISSKSLNIERGQHHFRFVCSEWHEKDESWRRPLRRDAEEPGRRGKNQIKNGDISYFRSTTSEFHLFCLTTSIEPSSFKTMSLLKKTFTAVVERWACIRVGIRGQLLTGLPLQDFPSQSPGRVCLVNGENSSNEGNELRKSLIDSWWVCSLRTHHPGNGQEILKHGNRVDATFCSSWKKE